MNSEHMKMKQVTVSLMGFQKFLEVQLEQACSFAEQQHSGK